MTPSFTTTDAHWIVFIRTLRSTERLDLLNLSEHHNLLGIQCIQPKNEKRRDRYLQCIYMQEFCMYNNGYLLLQRRASFSLITGRLQVEKSHIEFFKRIGLIISTKNLKNALWKWKFIMMLIPFNATRKVEQNRKQEAVPHKSCICSSKENANVIES